MSGKSLLDPENVPVYFLTKERAWNNLLILLPLPLGEGLGEGIKIAQVISCSFLKLNFR